MGPLLLGRVLRSVGDPRPLPSAGPVKPILFALCLLSCNTVNDATGGWGVDLGGGSVWECEVEDASRAHATVDLELCWGGGVDSLESSLWVTYGNEGGAGFASCRPTERHSGACWYRCPSQWLANALHGSHCP